MFKICMFMADVILISEENYVHVFRGSTYTVDIGLTLNFGLKILWLTYMPDQLVYLNSWY